MVSMFSALLRAINTMKNTIDDADHIINVIIFIVERPGLTGFCLVLQVIEDLLDHYRIFNTGNHLHGATADTAGLDVDVEYTFEALCPSHRRSPFGG